MRVSSCKELKLIGNLLPQHHTYPGTSQEPSYEYKVHAAVKTQKNICYNFRNVYHTRLQHMCRVAGTIRQDNKNMLVPRRDLRNSPARFDAPCLPPPPHCTWRAGVGSVTLTRRLQRGPHGSRLLPCYSSATRA